MVTRRGFLGALTALVAAPALPVPLPAVAPLAFHPDAFSVASNALTLDEANGFKIGDVVTVRLPGRPVEVYRITWYDVTSDSQ